MTQIILVTGGTGLVGSAIRKVIKSDVRINNNMVFIFLSRQDGDLTKEKDVISIFEKYKPTHIIHLAACVGGLYKNMNNNLKMYTENMKINQNILHYGYKYGVIKIISCLSTCIFPNKVTYPINESMLHNGLPHISNEGYSFAKRMLDVESKLYNREYGTKFVSIIPTNVYGPFDNYSLIDGHVIPSLIHKCFLAKRNKEKFIVYGSGRPLRQFIYSEDLAKLILWVLIEYNELDSIILSPKEEISIRDVANMISDIFEYDDIIFDTSKSDGQIRKTVSNEKLMNLNPSFKFTSLKGGLLETIEWFKENYENIRK